MEKKEIEKCFHVGDKVIATVPNKFNSYAGFDYFGTIIDITDSSLILKTNLGNIIVNLQHLLELKEDLK